MLKEQASPTSTSQRLKQKSSHLHRDGMPAFKRQAHRKSQAVPPALQPAKHLFLASYMSTQLFSQHRSSFTSDFRIYYTLDSPICLTRSQHQTAQRAFLNPSTQDQRNQWGGRKKAYTPNPQSLHHKHSRCQHLKHHCHGNHGTFSPADRRAGKETLVSSLLAG